MITIVTSAINGREPLRTMKIHSGGVEKLPICLRKDGTIIKALKRAR